MLTNLTLANNNLSGSLPTSWGTSFYRSPRFKHLQWLSLLPGALHSLVPVMRAAQSVDAKPLGMTSKREWRAHLEGRLQHPKQWCVGGGGRRLRCELGRSQQCTYRSGHIT